MNSELVVHVFWPLDGPAAATAYQQVRRLWTACSSRLGMTKPIPGELASTVPPESHLALGADGVLAAQESLDASRQAVLRRVHDVVILSVALAQPLPDGLRRPPAVRLNEPPSPQAPMGRPMGWAEWGQLWSQASAAGTDAALGEARLFLARGPGERTGAIGATPELGEPLEQLLPYREDRAREWWRRGTTTSSGFAVWDLSRGDTARTREIVVIAAEDRDDELSAWAWSDGTTELSPFARYLLHAAKLRYEARLLDSWAQGPRGGDIGEMLAELSVALDPDAPHPDKAGLLRSQLSRLRGEEDRLKALEADLERLSRTVTIARDNLVGASGPDAGAGAQGIFAADQALGRWLTLQIDDYLGYLRIDLGQTRHARERAAEELEQTISAEASGGDVSRQSGAKSGASAGTDIARRVFVVYGRDSRLTRRFFDLLRAADLRPLEWETLVEATGRATPSLAEVVALAPHLAQATLVLLSPDDIVELHSDLASDGDPLQERGLGAQARPNVLFELGLAMMAYPDRTVIVEVGQMRLPSDLAGLNVIRFDGSATAIRKVLHRLEMADCVVDLSGQDWLDETRFADLPAYQRGPSTHRARDLEGLEKIPQPRQIDSVDVTGGNDDPQLVANEPEP
jgi:predicted nucleotide-binding protein